MKHHKLWRKVISCMLTSIMVVSCFGGCGNQQKEQKEESKVSSSGAKTESSQSVPSEEEELVLGYPIEEDVTLTIAWQVEAPVTAHAADLSETAFGKAWQEATGVNIEIVSYADAAALNLLLSSGELPDIIYGNFNSYPGRAAGVINDGFVQPINDYMQYAPDLQAIFDTDEEVRKNSITANGEIIGFPCIGGDELADVTNSGMMIRKDWLDDLGMEVPTTADELYNVLKAFKEEKGAKYPFTGQSGYILDVGLHQGLFTSPFNLPRGDFYQIDGKVHYGYYEEEMKDVLTFLKKLVDEELLNPNFLTLDDSAVTADMVNGVSGMGIAPGSRSYRWYNYGQEVNSDYDIAAMAPLKTSDGQLAMCSTYDGRISGNCAFITTSCENIEAAVRFLNYGYTDEGVLLFTYGIEGITYKINENNEIDVLTGTTATEHHPDWSEAEIKAYYNRGWNHAPYVRRDVYPEAMNSDAARMFAARETFAKSQVLEYMTPTLQNFMSYEDSKEVSELLAEIDTYRGEMITKFILGTESLDNFEKYQQTLKEMKVERVLEIYQSALDAYNANK